MANTVFCISCNEEIEVDNSVSMVQKGKHGRVYLCRNCHRTPEKAGECSICGKEFYRGFLINGPEPETYFCLWCAKHMFIRCGYCGKAVLKKQAIYLAYAKAHFCLGCVQYRPLSVGCWEKRVIFVPQGRGPVFFGSELEVDGIGSSRPDVLRTWNQIHPKIKWLLAKTDASLRNGGFELVTQPMDFNVVKDNLELFDYLFETIRMGGMGARETAGMHVHMNKDAFSTPQLFKLLRFFLENPFYVQHICGRGSCSYASYERGIVVGTKSIAAAARDKEGNSNNRYACINLCPKYTVEIRAFASVDNTHNFMRNIEFCHAVFCFCRETSFKKLAEGDFEEFLEQRTGLYPRLAAFLLNRPPKLAEIDMKVDGEVEEEVEEVEV